MSHAIRCPRCSHSRQAHVTTDMQGRTVDLTEPCDCEGRRVCECVDCEGRFLVVATAHNARRCPDCRKVHNRAMANALRRRRKRTDPEYHEREKARQREQKRRLSPEKRKAIQRRRGLRETEKKRERNRIYRLNNLERERVRRRKRYIANREYELEQRKLAREAEQRIRRAA